MNAFLAFGMGPHSCIGMRIGLLQTKLGLIHFLRHHRVVTCEKTPKTAQLDKKGAVMCMQNILKVEKVI